MVSKNNLCSYSLYSLYGQLNELWFLLRGLYELLYEPLNQSNPLKHFKHSEHSEHFKHSNPVKHVEPFKRFKEIDFNALEWMGR